MQASKHVHSYACQNLHKQLRYSLSAKTFTVPASRNYLISGLNLKCSHVYAHIANVKPSLSDDTRRLVYWCQYLLYMHYISYLTCTYVVCAMVSHHGICVLCFACLCTGGRMYGIQLGACSREL